MDNPMFGSIVTTKRSSRVTADHGVIATGRNSGLGLVQDLVRSHVNGPSAMVSGDAIQQKG
jgi:hypothetical protein